MLHKRLKVHGVRSTTTPDLCELRMCVLSIREWDCRHRQYLPIERCQAMLEIIRTTPPPWRPGATADEILRWFRMLPQSLPWKGCPQDGGIKRIDEYKRYPCERCGRRRALRAAMWRRKLGLPSDPLNATREEGKKRKITSRESSTSESTFTLTESPTSTRVIRSRALSALGTVSTLGKDDTSTFKRRRVDTAPASYIHRTVAQPPLASICNQDNRISVTHTSPILPKAAPSSIRRYSNKSSAGMPAVQGVRSLGRSQHLESPPHPSGGLTNSEYLLESPWSLDCVDDNALSMEGGTEHQ